MTGLHDTLTAQGAALLGYFLNRLEARDDAPDLVGEVFLVAWRRARDVPTHPDEARMWLFGVARRVLANHRRGHARREALDARLRERLVAIALPSDAERVEIRAAVQELSEPLAEVVRLVHWDGFSLEEAAVLLDIPPSTARSRHARAKELLRHALSADEESHNGISTLPR